jgi:PBP1b-binding outer membrane lipoprotein LpoB
MRRFYALILTACLLLTGCAARSETPVRTTVRTQAETTTAAGATTAAETSSESAAETESARPAAAARISVAVSVERGEEKDTDGTALLTTTVARPSVTIAGNAEAGAAANEAIGRSEAALLSDDAQLVEAAKEQRADPTDQTWVPYSIDRSYLPGRIDAAVVSLVSTDIVNTGGAHPNNAMFGISFSAVTGKRLTLADLSDDESAFRAAVTEEITAQVSKMAAQLYPDAAESAKTLLDEDDWYFSEDGFVVLCNEYIMAPHAAGTLKFPVPYGKLYGLLKKELLPPDRAASDGEPQVAAADQADLSGRAAEELPLDENGQRVALTASGTVQNLRISEAVWDSDYKTCAPGRLFYACSSLGPEDAVLLTTVIPESAPSLILTWDGADGTARSACLTQSGKDGSILLMDVSLTTNPNS